MTAVVAAPVRNGQAIHVAHVVLRLDVGGLERVVLDLVREAQIGGHTASVVCLERPGALADTAMELGAQVECVGKRPGLRPGVIGRIARTLVSLQPDIVHTHQIGALLYAGPAARRLRIPVVHTEHGKHYAGRLRTRVLGRFAARSARRIFAVSADILRELRDCRVAPPAKLVHVPNGVDIARFEVDEDRIRLRRAFRLPPDVPVIGTVGRLTGVKRQDVLLKGFARLREPRARLLIVGDGPAREDLVSLAGTLGIADRAVFAGYRDRPELALAVMDVFALTSDSEGMPVSILEAWAAGKPVVASRVGGVPELVIDGQTGLLFPAGEDGALAHCLNRVLDEPMLATAIARAGGALVRERYDTRVMAATYLDHYRQLIQPTVRA